MYDDGGAFDGADGGAFGGGIEPLGPDGMMPSGSIYIRARLNGYQINSIFYLIIIQFFI